MTIRLAAALLAVAVAAEAQNTPPEPTAVYYVVFLRPDPARKPISKDEGERMQAAHMANIQKMADDGILAAAGPFEDDPPPVSGIFVMKTATLEEARRIAAEDPTVRGRRNTIDIHAWRGPAAIGDEYFRLHREHPETPPDMGEHPFFVLNRGPEWNATPPPRRVILLAEHQRFVEELRHADRLAAAGTAERDPEMIAIVIFRRVPFDQATERMKDDPAVKAGILAIEAHRWWSAAHVLPW
jgi:uncharacterized protein YciI